MKHPSLILCVCSILLGLVLLGAGCTSAPTGGKTPVPTVTTPVLPTTTVFTPEQSSCGFTTCHGLDLSCGMNAPQVCTMEYKLGDKCRKYARCEMGSGRCTLVTAPQFVTCKACVEQCEIGAGSDGLMAFDCEAKC